MTKMILVHMKKRIRNFTVIIDKGEDGFYVGSVPALKGCHTQGKTIDELLKNIKEAIELCLEVEKDVPDEHFIGIQQVQVKA
ncbi:MAG TPA: type II toxin-antitoxin system HicB family antitoxin [Candidatus Nanoarchaeia archaeon]|nr:type II toxin-antitoxin system HicB family antitoxin [Candidatus Nanoarchaeia archaeon]